MKKRIVGIMALSLVGAMMVTSLTGCGLQTKATDITVDDGDTIIVDQEDMETEATEDPEVTEAPMEETKESEPEEITSTEVIGENTDAPNESGNLEDDNIILYAEKSECCENLEQYEYSAYDGVINAQSVIGLCDGEGYRVGEMKIGGTVYVGEVDRVHNWARFENPITGTEYEYLYTSASYVESNNKSRISASDAETIIKEVLGNEDVYTYTNVTDDMELFEFRIPMYYDETESPKDVIYFQFTDFCEDIWYHHTFAIMCTEDTDDYILCQIYYKD